MRLVACVLSAITIAAAVETVALVSPRADRLIYIGTYTGETSK